MSADDVERLVLALARATGKTPEVIRVEHGITARPTRTNDHLWASLARGSHTMRSTS